MSKNYIDPTDERDLMDLAALAKGRLRLARCPGGRYTDISTAPYLTTCAHCGVSLLCAQEDSFCGQPLHEDGMTPFDATVARRIMEESAAQFDEETFG